MGRFKIILIGAHQAPTIEADAETVYDLANLLGTRRWIVGEMAEIDGCPVSGRVLLATCRIQMAIEESDQ